jgi:hypothetical protein
MRMAAIVSQGIFASFIACPWFLTTVAWNGAMLAACFGIIKR